MGKGLPFPPEDHPGTHAEPFVAKIRCVTHTETFLWSMHRTDHHYHPISSSNPKVGETRVPGSGVSLFVRL